MNEAEITPEKLLSAILTDKYALAVARLKQVQPIISEIFMVPEIDIPRMEACNCYVIGATTACVTLTSHLLERYCKELLIQVDFGPRDSFQKRLGKYWISTETFSEMALLIMTQL